MKPIRAEQLFRQIEEISANVPTPSDPASQNGEANLVDWVEAGRAVNGDQGLLIQVLAAFLAEGPHLLETLETSYKIADWKRFQRAAHTLKSALRTFGVKSADEVEKLELDAKIDTASILESKVTGIISRVRPVFVEMKSHLQLLGVDGNI